VDLCGLFCVEYSPFRLSAAPMSISFASPLVVADDGTGSTDGVMADTADDIAFGYGVGQLGAIWDGGGGWVGVWWFHLERLLFGSDTARSQPKESIVLISDGLHEVIQIRDFVVGDILCLNVAVYIDAVVKAMSEPTRAHLDLPFPGDSSNVLVSKRSPPCFSLGKFESFRR
jgi:hypothetical protein